MTSPFVPSFAEIAAALGYTGSNLDTSLSGKAAASHTHAQADVTGLTSALSGKEPTITAGTSAQWWRGDKTWALLSAADIGPGYWLPNRYTSGNYYCCASSASSSTSNALGNQTLRVAPWIVTQAISVSKLWVEHTAAGESGSVFRIGVFADDGTGKPGNVLADGTVSTAGSAAVQEISVSLTLTPGVYWSGGVVQGASTTQPTMRIIAPTQVEQPALSFGTTLPAAGSARTGWSVGSISGALSNGPAVALSGGNVARIGFKVA